MHRSDVLCGLSRAEVDSEHRLRGLALEGVHGLGESRADTHLNARHGSLEPNNRARGTQDDGAAQTRIVRRRESPKVVSPIESLFWSTRRVEPIEPLMGESSRTISRNRQVGVARWENETPRICTLVYQTCPSLTPRVAFAGVAAPGM